MLFNLATGRPPVNTSDEGLSIMETLYVGDYLIMAFCYLFCLAVWQSILAGLATVVLVLFFRRRPWFRKAIKFIWILNLMLLRTGFLLNVVWNLTVFNRLYWIYDYVGVECSPLGLMLFDYEWGPLTFFYGLTKWHIRALWLVYAILAWGSAIWLTRIRITGYERPSFFWKYRPKSNNTPSAYDRVVRYGNPYASQSGKMDAS